MNFIVACAGIPVSIYDAVYDERATVVGPNGIFVGAPLKPRGDGVFVYDTGYAGGLIRRVWELFQDDAHYSLRDTGLLFVYVHLVSSSYLVREFFPFAFPLAVDWPLEIGRGMPDRIRKNQLVQKFKATVDLGKSIIPAIKREVQSDANSTPLLLPLRNFKSIGLADLLSSVADGVVSTGDRRAAIKELTADFKRRYFTDRRFEDDRGIAFKSPGNARHAFARPGASGQHRHSCLLAGHERLGAPYDRSFHYDCTKGDRPLSGRFSNCHDVEAAYAGRPHLNIAPNDYVR